MAWAGRRNALWEEVIRVASDARNRIDYAMYE